MMDLRTTDDVAVYRKALAELSHNRYVVLDADGHVSDTQVLMDGDTVLSEVIPDEESACTVCGFSVGPDGCLIAHGHGGGCEHDEVRACIEHDHGWAVCSYCESDLTEEWWGDRQLRRSYALQPNTLGRVQVFNRRNEQ
jgi:hypothetical protein